VGVVSRGLVAAGVAVVLSTTGAPAASAHASSGPTTPPQTIVPGLVIRKAPDPEPERESRPQRDPLADVVEERARDAVRQARRELPTEMDLRLVHANILSRMSPSQFRADLLEATAGAPDFVTLNEATRPPELLALPGYAFHRGTGDRWAMETTVMWRTDRWEALATGTRLMHQRRGTWGTRVVNWVTARSVATGKVVSVVSAHASPVGKGTPDLLPVYMSACSQLVRDLSAHGPVFAGGDLNADLGSGRFPRAGLRAGGLSTTYDVHGRPPGGTGDHGGHTIDYLLYQPGAGVSSTSQWKMELFSDHDAVAGDFHLDW